MGISYQGCGSTPQLDSDLAKASRNGVPFPGPGRHGHGLAGQVVSQQHGTSPARNGEIRPKASGKQWNKKAAEFMVKTIWCTEFLWLKFMSPTCGNQSGTLSESQVKLKNMFETKGWDLNYCNLWAFSKRKAIFTEDKWPAPLPQYWRLQRLHARGIMAKQLANFRSGWFLENRPLLLIPSHAHDLLSARSHVKRGTQNPQTYSLFGARTGRVPTTAAGRVRMRWSVNLSCIRPLSRYRL